MLFVFGNFHLNLLDIIIYGRSFLFTIGEVLYLHTSCCLPSLREFDPKIAMLGRWPAPVVPTCEVSMFSFVKSLVRDQSGATAIEYGLIAALIAVAAIGGMSSLGTQLASIFNRVATTLQNAGT